MKKIFSLNTDNNFLIFTFSNFHFIEKLPKANDKKTIIFSTYAIRKGKANVKLENELTKMGYRTILSLSKRGFKLGQQDFAESIEQIITALEQ